MSVLRLLGILAPLWLTACVGDSGPSEPIFGAISVTTTTGGFGLDPDGYSITVDGEAGETIGINETLVLTDLAPGTYSVELGEVADNCVVLDGASQAIVVEAGGIAEVTFELDCSSEPLPAPTARLTITDESGQSVTEGGRLEVTVPAGTFASFTFDAALSEPGAGSTIATYEWLSNGLLVGTQERFEFALDAGEYLITLTVTNSAGLSETASATIIVTE